jgi:hypothetical protein
MPPKFFAERNILDVKKRALAQQNLVNDKNRGSSLLLLFPITNLYINYVSKD